MPLKFFSKKTSRKKKKKVLYNSLLKEKQTKNRAIKDA